MALMGIFPKNPSSLKPRNLRIKSSVNIQEEQKKSATLPAKYYSDKRVKEQETPQAEVKTYKIKKMKTKQITI